MDRILIILKKENGPRASSVPALGLNTCTMIFQHVYWYMQQISGERLQDHWSSGSKLLTNLLGHRQDSVTNIRHTRLNSAVIARTWQYFLTITIYNYLLRIWCTKVLESVTKQLRV